jgi:hypothetical protein
MFKNKIRTALVLWIGIFLLLLAVFGRFTNRDAEVYRVLTNHAGSLQETSENKQVKQNRSNVTKHFLKTKDGERIQFYLRGSSSDVVYDQKENKAEVTEHFKDVTCLMQEEPAHKTSDELQNLPEEAFFTGIKPEPVQTVRQIDAETAVYRYHSEDLFADRVKIARYLAPGNELHSELQASLPLMTGTASQVECDFSGEAKPFKARQLQATFRGEKKIP